MKNSYAPAERSRAHGGSSVARVSESRMQTIEDLIHRARRRLLLNETLGQAAFAAAIVAGGVALILLVGTRYLEWWLLTVLAVAAVALGGIRVARRMPGAYAIARRLDNAARLHDLLSTAIYFRIGNTRDAEMLEAQRRQAEAAARGVHLESAIPLRFPRAIYPLAALSLLASSLVVLRYALTRSLDLHAPLTEVLFEDQLARREVKKPAPPASEKSFQALKAAEALMAKLNMPASPDQAQDPDALDKAIDQALAPPSSQAAKSDKAAAGQKSGQQNGANNPDSAQNGDPLNGDQKSADAQPNAKSQQGQQSGSPNDKGRPGNGDNSSPSLLSKLKDAVSNMFSRARESGSQGGQKSASQQNSQMAKSDQKAGEKSQSGKGQQQAESQADAQEGDPNGDPQQGQQAEGKSAAKTSAQNSAQAGSGVGSQNGAKDLRAAEQLRAMGKITEIFGKRAATISGETMVEVQSGNQQLRTSYSEQAATHGEAASDISRDQIPPALETYVANYFEQVRKGGNAAGKGPEGKPAAKPVNVQP